MKKRILKYTIRVNKKQTSLIEIAVKDWPTYTQPFTFWSQKEGHTAAATKRLLLFCAPLRAWGVFFYPISGLGQVKRAGGGGGFLPPSAGAYLLYTAYRAIFRPVLTSAPRQ